jgi:hypothetical protein
VKKNPDGGAGPSGMLWRVALEVTGEPTCQVKNDRVIFIRRFCLANAPQTIDAMTLHDPQLNYMGACSPMPVLLALVDGALRPFAHLIRRNPGSSPVKSVGGSCMLPAIH